MSPKNTTRLRLVTQLGFLAVVTVTAALHRLDGNAHGSIDALCPFGGLETLYKLLAGGEYLKRVLPSNIVLLVGTVVLGLILARFFCGFICALGTLQELFGKLGRKLFGRRFEVPAKVDAPLRYLKYVVLVAVLGWTWAAGELVIRPYDPFAAYGHIWAGAELFDEFLVGAILLFGSLGLSLFWDRVFCKYLCPLGAFLALLHKASPFRLMRAPSSCTNCRLCTHACPVNIPVEKQDVVSSAECIGCLECVVVCPTKKETLKPTFAGRVMKPLTVAIAGVAIYVGIIGTAKALGRYSTTEGTLAEQALHGGRALLPADIRGKYTLADVSAAFFVPIEKLYAQLGLDASRVPPNTQIKSIGRILGVEGEYVEKVREAVAGILAGGDGSGLPVKAPAAAEKAPVENARQVGSVDGIKGTMTLRQVADEFKIDVATLYEGLNLPRERVSENIPMREIKAILKAEGRDFEVQEVRDYLNRSAR